MFQTQWAELHRSNIPSFLTEDGWVLEGAWNDHLSTDECTTIVDGIFARSKSTINGIHFWGDEISHDVHLAYDGNSVEELFLRVDMRAQFEPMLKKANELAHKLDCSILVMEKAKLLKAHSDSLPHIAVNSRAMNWVKDQD